MLYRGDGRTFLYVEEQRTDDSIELREPYTKLLIRLTADKFEMRRSPEQPWRRSARGRWVSEANQPERIRQAPQGYEADRHGPDCVPRAARRIAEALRAAAA